ncbi:MAG: ATP-binding protein [Lentisphaeria bacterium]|nr:ATP-binding protein [Lentisphaeria bacterium]
MRALRKVIFVNSANIRYAEVCLDGNVHFIGTQGVGKSTLLRAILFFYNADKLHLGIPKEMKGFDEFYLPNANSYIVYEVEREDGPFSVLVYRSSGRACYRFVASAFQREWLIDETGEVTADIKVIRSRLGNTMISKMVDRYDQYRDIIYGCESAKEFRCFQLMETRNYQNIYRSIHNVFLNSRLEANFIKDIIIRSLNDEESGINLGFYRGQVTNFKQEYDDVICWDRRNSKGESIVGKQADLVISAYHNLLYLKNQIGELCGELKCSVRMARERLPLVEEKIARIEAERERQERLQDELKGKYRVERSRLDGELGVKKDKLAQCAQKRKDYEAQQIDNVLARCNQENVRRSELEAARTRYDELTAKYEDVASKYKSLVESEKNRLAALIQAQKLSMGEIQKEALIQKEKLFGHYHVHCRENEELWNDKLDGAREALEGIRQEERDCIGAINDLKNFKPYEAEIADFDKQLRDFEESQRMVAKEITSLDAEGKRLQAEYEFHIEQLETECKAKVHAKQVEIEKLKCAIADIDKLLAKVNGSFYEWLDENLGGWEQTIGKVIDERTVLYNTGLAPQKASVENASFYGVDVDLTKLPLTIRRPDELKAQRTELDGQIGDAQKAMAAFERERDANLEDLKRKSRPQIKELRNAKALKEAEAAKLPGQIKMVCVKRQELLDKAEQIVAARRQELSARQQEIAHRKNAASADLARVQDEKKRHLKELEKGYVAAKERIDAELSRSQKASEAEIKRQQEASETEVLRLRQQELAELEGQGADTTAVAQCKQQIAALEGELNFIEQHRKLVYAFQKDKEELFDREEEFKNEKKTLVAEIQNLDEKYEQRRVKYEQLIGGLNVEADEGRQELHRLQTGLAEAEKFCQDDRMCPAGLLDAPEKQTLALPDQAVNELRNRIFDRQEQQNDFKQKVNVFKGNFSAKNTFNFKTVLNLDEDYLEFADNLNEFVQNNMIEQYRKRISEKYAEILGRVSKEMGDLTKHRSDVDTVINNINRDFVDKNFVGVIKRIELRSVETSDKMVQLMLRIKDFNDENSYDIGELSLFSTANRSEVNQKAVEYLRDLMKVLDDNPARQSLNLSDLFQLQFRVVENDNDTGWTDKLSHVGSEGTDTLVKAMVNIMLINVFKEKVAQKFGDFKIHCMMDEIGKLHPQNIKGILNFANARNILLVNSSPTTYNVSDYRYTYLLGKEGTKTQVRPLIVKK